jgi:hypothetical protein
VIELPDTGAGRGHTERDPSQEVPSPPRFSANSCGTRIRCEASSTASYRDTFVGGVSRRGVVLAVVRNTIAEPRITNAPPISSIFTLRSAE